MNKSCPITILFLLLMVSLSSCTATQSGISEDSLTDTGNGIIVSDRFNLMWQQHTSQKFESAEEAQNYVDLLSLGGYSDWRLPTKAESHNLFYSYDFGKSDTKNLKMKMDGAVWVLLDNNELQAGTWDAGETCCIVRTFLKEREGRVRAVRP